MNSGFCARAPFLRPRAISGRASARAPIEPKAFPRRRFALRARPAGHPPGNVVSDISFDRWRIGGYLPDSNDFKLRDINLLEADEIALQFLEKTVAAQVVLLRSVLEEFRSRSQALANFIVLK